MMRMAAGRCGDVCKARLLQELTAVRELRRPRAPEAWPIWHLSAPDFRLACQQAGVGAEIIATGSNQ